MIAQNERPFRLRFAGPVRDRLSARRRARPRGRGAGLWTRALASAPQTGKPSAVAHHRMRAARIASPPPRRPGAHGGSLGERRGRALADLGLSLQEYFLDII